MDSREFFKPVSSNKDIFLNASLSDEPCLQEDFLAMPFDGTFLTNEAVFNRSKKS